MNNGSSEYLDLYSLENLTPFAGADVGGHQTMGVYIGTGDQDNYIKLVTNSGGLTGGVQFAAEREGIFQQLNTLWTISRLLIAVGCLAGVAVRAAIPQ